MDTTNDVSGKVIGIAVKTERKQPMKEISTVQAVVDGGLTDDLPVSRKRGITLIDRKAWEATCSDLGIDLPWTLRRANVLTEGLDLEKLIGKSIQIGEVDLEIGGETEPCNLMEQLHSGLEEALKPDCRGGVYGRVVRAGKIEIGDLIVLTQG